MCQHFLIGRVNNGSGGEHRVGEPGAGSALGGRARHARRRVQGHDKRAGRQGRSTDFALCGTTIGLSAASRGLTWGYQDQWRMLDPTSRRGLARAFAAGHTEAVTKIAFLGSAAELLQGSTEDRALFCMDWALHFDDPTPGAEPSAAVTHKTEVALPRLRRNLGAPTSRDRRSLLMAAGGRPVTLKRMLDFITAVASASLRLLRVLDGYKDPVRLKLFFVCVLCFTRLIFCSSACKCRQRPVRRPGGPRALCPPAAPAGPLSASPVALLV